MKLTKQFKGTESKMLFNNNDERFKMSINKETEKHITDRLTYLYANPLEALVREIMSNAYDSMSTLEDKVIEVTLPTTLESTLTIKDHGTGMSKRQLIEEYSQYGVSTKGDDLSQTGAYGLGAKSPLAYCSQFTVISVKDNIKTEISISSESDGNFIDVISSKEVIGESNGTTVIVPIHQEEKGQDHKVIRDLFYRYQVFAKDFRVLVNGSEIKKEVDKIENLSDLKINEDISLSIYGIETINKPKILLNIALNLDGYLKGIKFNLFGWIYNNPNKYSLTDRNLREGLYIDLVPGIVDFSSSRDEISKNARFDNFYEMIKSHLQVELKGIIEENLSNGSIKSAEVFEILTRNEKISNKVLEGKELDKLQNSLFNEIEFCDGKSFVECYMNMPKEFDIFNLNFIKRFEFKKTKTIARINNQYTSNSENDGTEQRSLFNRTAFTQNKIRINYKEGHKYNPTSILKKSEVDSVVIFTNVTEDTKELMLLNRINVWVEENIKTSYAKIQVLSTNLTKEESLSIVQQFIPEKTIKEINFINVSDFYSKFENKKVKTSYARDDFFKCKKLKLSTDILNEISNSDFCNLFETSLDELDKKFPRETNHRVLVVSPQMNTLDHWNKKYLYNKAFGMSLNEKNTIYVTTTYSSLNKTNIDSVLEFFDNFIRVTSEDNEPMEHGVKYVNEAFLNTNKEVFISKDKFRVNPNSKVGVLLLNKLNSLCKYGIRTSLNKDNNSKLLELKNAKNKDFNKLPVVKIPIEFTDFYFDLDNLNADDRLLFEVYEFIRKNNHIIIASYGLTEAELNECIYYRNMIEDFNAILS